MLALLERQSANSTSGTTTPSPAFRFFPQGGNPYADLIFANFVDLDSSSGTKDYSCGAVTYDGHLGIDSSIRTFDEQRIGVPVFAVEDGVVLVAVDGYADENTECDGSPANYVYLAHDGGRRTLYVHLRKDSVAVEAGQAVTAGEQIGLTGSSGCSRGPHLHFESRLDGASVEPFAGTCRPGASGWSRQPPYKTTTYLIDFGVTSEDLSNAPPHPHRLPTSSQIGFDEAAHFWARVANLPKGSTWRVRFLRPSGTLALDSGTTPFGNTAFFRMSRWKWKYQLREFQSVTGAWKFLLDINGKRMITAPFLVVAKKTAGFNRAPSTVGLAFDPDRPQPSNALFCRVSTSLTLDDLDWDVVRYHYTWKVNGTTVRTTTSAAHSDAIRRNLTKRRDVVECTVAPGDGKTWARATSVRVASGCYADCDGSGRLDANDFSCFYAASSKGKRYADCNDDGRVDGTDDTCFAQKFRQGCG